MTFHMSSLVIRKSFWSIPVYFSGLFSILLSIFLLCLSILRNPTVFDLSPVSVFKQKLSQHNKEEQSTQVAVVAYFPLDSVNKQGFFEILSPQSILLVPSFSRMKSGNIDLFLTLIFLILFKSVRLAVWKLEQWGKKCVTVPASLPQSHNGYRVY